MRKLHQPDVLRTLSLRGFALLLPVALAAGCASEGPSDYVVGKVTLGGKPVAGEVLFVDSGGKIASSPIGPEGNYRIDSAPRGVHKVAVRSIGLSTTGGGSPVKGANLPTIPDAPPPPSGQTPPAKFADPRKSTLVVEVKGGKQEFNISLD